MGKKMFLAIIFCTVFTMFAGLSRAADPYVLGFITDFTGAGKTVYGPEGEGFRVYMDVVNGRGGIEGHPVKVIYEDDKTDAARAQSVATKLILEDRVLAIVGLGFSFTHKPIYRLATEHGLPVVCGYGCVAPVYDAIKQDCRNIFSGGMIYGAEYSTATWVALLLGAKVWPKGTTFGSISYAVPGGRMLSAGTAKLGVERNGWKLVYHEDMPPEAVDLSPWAMKAANANPEVIFMTVSEDTFVPFLAALEKYGYKGATYITEISTRGFLKAVDGLVKPKDNIYMNGFIELGPPLGDTPVPGHEEIAKAMRKFGHKFEWTSRHTNGWLYGRILEEALRKAGWPCDRSTLLKALEKTNIETEGLRAGPYRFSPTDHRGPEYGKLYRWDPNKRVMKTAVDWVTWSARDILKLGN